MEIEAKEAKFPREACDAVAVACIWRQTGAVGRAVHKGPQNLALCCVSNELWSWGGGSLLPWSSGSLPAAPEDKYHTPLAPQSPKVPGCCQSASQMIPANSQHPNSTLLGSSSLIPHCWGHPLTFALSKRDPWGALPPTKLGDTGDLWLRRLQPGPLPTLGAQGHIHSVRTLTCALSCYLSGEGAKPWVWGAPSREGSIRVGNVHLLFVNVHSHTGLLELL